jgi:flagellar biosynthesis/type III secretory pathway M-ring protein FliF/YscJ
MHVNVSGNDMHLACPTGNLNISDFSWQLASRLRYTCWDGKHHQQLLDYLVSSSNGLDKIDTTSVARGDGRLPPSRIQQQEQEAQQQKRFWQSKSATIAGAVVGTVVGIVLLSMLMWFIVGRKIMATRKAQSFEKFKDDHSSAVAAPVADADAASSSQADPVNRGNSSSAAI